MVEHPYTSEPSVFITLTLDISPKSLVYTKSWDRSTFRKTKLSRSLRLIFRSCDGPESGDWVLTIATLATTARCDKWYSGNGYKRTYSPVLVF